MLDYCRHPVRLEAQRLRRPAGRSAARALVFAGASLTALTIAVPAQAECSVTGNLATCTGTDPTGVMVTGPSVSIISTADVSTTNDAGPGLVSGALYALSINGIPETDHASIESVGDVSTRGAKVTAIMAGAINSLGGATGTVRVDSRGNVSTAGAGGNGIWAFSRGPEAWVRSVGDVTTGGAGAAGIIASSLGETTLRAAGNVQTAGEGAYGLVASGKNVTIDSSGRVATSGDDASAILVAAFDTIDGETVRVGGIAGNALVTVDAVFTEGANSHGIDVATNGGSIKIEAGTIETRGSSSDGIRAQTAGEEDIAITVAKMTTAGPNSTGIDARTASGDGVVEVGTLNASGANSNGVFVSALSGTASVTTTGDVAVADGVALRGQGAAVLIATGSGTTTRGGTGVQVHEGMIDIEGNIVHQVNVGTVEIINLGTVVGAGSGSDTGAINVATTGDVDIVSNITRSAGSRSYGIYASSVLGSVSIDSTSAVLEGNQPLSFETRPDGQFVFNDYSAIRAAAVDRASVRVDDASAVGENGSGIWVNAREVDVTVDGTVQAAMYGINASAGYAQIQINGSVVSDTGGIALVAGSGVVDIAAGAKVIGGQNGVSLIGSTPNGFLQFYNSGTVEGGDGAAVLGEMFGQGSTDFYIQNNGILIGGDGTAVRTGKGNDTLELTNLSQIAGIADLGEGDDRLVLDLNDDAPAGAIGQVVSTINVEGLSVDTGHWRAEGVQSRYDFVEIEAGATLTVVENRDGDLAVETGLVELEGALRLAMSADETAADLGGATITGGGSLHLIGTATVELADASGLRHTGGTFVENGELVLTTVYGGDITTSGDGVFELAEGGDFTGNLVNDGAFVFSRTDTYRFMGDFRGSGLLEKRGEGALTFAGLYAFEGTTSILGGSVAFAGQLADDTALDLSDGAVDLSQVAGGQQTIGQLSGTGGALQLGSTQLIIEQTGDSEFSGSLSGDGGLIKEGDGDLKLNGDGSGFTGTGQVDGGRLSVNGDFSNASFLINEGGTLGGSGTVGDTGIGGGTLAPGNSIGTLTVAGNVSFTASSLYEVEVDAAGNTDLLQATGTAILGGAQVQVIAESGNYRPLTDYVILTADGGVDGTFGSVETNLAFLDPSLIYGTNAVTLRLVRNSIDFASFAATPNQAAIANLIESFGYGNTLYDEAVTLVGRDVAQSLASLTGDIYPAYGAALIETAEMLRRQTRNAPQAGEGAYVWGTGLYNRVDGGKASGGIDLSGQGAAGGVGFGAGGFSASAGIGFLDQNRGGGRFSDGEVTFVIGQLAYAGMGGFSIGAGVQFGWADAQTRRQTALGSISQAVTGHIDGNYVQLFGDIAHRIPVGDALGIEPFVGIGHVSLDLDALAESGAPTALAVSAIDRKVTFADIGLRVSGEAGEGLKPFVSAAYRRASGDRASLAAVGFVGTTGTALMTALPIAKSAAELSGGIVVTRGAIDFELGYDATISKGFDSQGINAGLKIRF